VRTIAIIMTSYNRKNKTISCLDSLFSQEELGEKFHYLIYLVDDGSTDGTSEAVHLIYPGVRIIPGTGDLFWNRGMHLAFGEALKQDHEFYLWMNDDTTLFPDALTRLLETSSLFQDEAIVVASTKDPDTSEWTYGGLRRLDRCRRLKFTPIQPGTTPVLIEAMNGNCVLFPRQVARILGNLDPVYSHGMGDFDYSLRAQKQGVKVILAPGYYGYCTRNAVSTESKSFRQRFSRMISRKGLPPKDWAVFSKRYAGPLWPFYWVSPYIRIFFHR
jgi:GT2 family glycosyltransferase